VSPYQVIRNAIPAATDSLCEHIIWGRTPYPFVRLTAKSLWKAADRFRRAEEHGVELCEMCDRPAKAFELCQSCGQTLLPAKFS
jgi:hypothetical protein